MWTDKRQFPMQMQGLRVFDDFLTGFVIIISDANDVGGDQIIYILCSH